MSLVTRPFAHVTELDSIGQDDQINLAEAERLACLAAGAALAVFAVLRRSPVGVILGLLGGALIFRGGSGYCALYEKIGVNTARPQRGVRADQGIKVEHSLFIARPPYQLFSFWRHLDNLPRFMPHLESVEETGDGISHWVVKGPLGTHLEWDAEIINELPGHMISWQTLPGSTVASAGSVWFEPEGEGTQVKVSLQYQPIGGAAGAIVARLLGESPEQQIAEDLARFKTLVEHESQTW